MGTVSSPRRYVENIVHEFVKTLPCEPEDSVRPRSGDTSIIENALSLLDEIYSTARLGMDTIEELCGVCVEWHAANEVCLAVLAVLTLLEDVLCLAMCAELVEAALCGELIYQQSP